MDKGAHFLDLLDRRADVLQLLLQRQISQTHVSHIMAARGALQEMCVNLAIAGDIAALPEEERDPLLDGAGKLLRDLDGLIVSIQNDLNQRRAPHE